jgi:hypothetical protein
MGAQARERIVRSYNLRAIVGRYDELYSEVSRIGCLTATRGARNTAQSER